MIRRPPRSTQSRSSAASDVYKRQVHPLEFRLPGERLQAKHSHYLSAFLLHLLQGNSGGISAKVSPLQAEQTLGQEVSDGHQHAPRENQPRRPGAECLREYASVRLVSARDLPQHSRQPAFVARFIPSLSE